MKSSYPPKKMKKLALKQEKLISEDQIREFMELSNQRESLKHEISKNSRRYSNVEKNRSDRGMHRKNSTLSMEIADVIQSIQEVDKRIGEFILEKRDDLLDQAKRLKKGKRALKGYVGKSQRRPRFIDRKG